MSTKVSISEAFDGGNIIAVGQIIESIQSKNHIKVALKIRPDPFTDLEKVSHFQYFSFRSTIANLANSEGIATTPTDITYEIINAGEASYAEAWVDSTVFYTTNVNDPDSWRRIRSTDYNAKEKKLVWSHPERMLSSEQATDTCHSIYFAYFPPYSYSRHLDLVERCSQYGTVFSLGQSLEGRELECVRVGHGERIGWIIHRQHPGEHMAEFYAEGLLTRLLGLESQGDTDGLVRQLLTKYTFYVVPSMNPDGAISGHLRTNACGANPKSRVV